MEKPGMSLHLTTSRRAALLASLILDQLDRLRAHPFTGLEPAAIGNHHLFSLGQSGDHFGIVGGLQSEHHRPLFHRSLRADHTDRSLTALPVDRL